MITTIHTDVTVRSNYIAGALHTTELIRAMAVQMVAAQVEGHLDMISDAGPKEYSTFEDVSGCIAGAKETVVDYVEDLLEEFRTSLLAEIARVKIDTKAVILKPEGEIDADVVVSIAE